VWAFGWLINRLLERPPSAMAVLGTWLISLPFLIPAIPTLFVLLLLTPLDDLPHTLIGIIPTVVFAACHAILVVRVTLAYYRDEPDVPGSQHPR
ncbi:MAG: hypothetical protein ACYTGF_02240, partial [Planctomycetota bacterium]